MKKLLLLILACSILLCWTNLAFSLPLQLDISDGTYDTATKTIFASGDQFTLYALIDSTKENKFNPNDEFYISAALVPDPNAQPGTDPGSFKFGSETIDVNSDMIYGTPAGLPTHGIFDTDYWESDPFMIKPANTAAAYNSQDNPGGLVPDSNGDLYYVPFVVDTSDLALGYTIHFDLYNKNPDGTVNKNAPFSHDHRFSR